MCDVITYPFSNVNGCTTKVWEWIRNFIAHFTGHVTAYELILHENIDDDIYIYIERERERTSSNVFTLIF